MNDEITIVNEPKFCYLVIGELRCLDYIKNLYEHLIDFYDADIIICCQDLPGKQDNIELFDRKVVYKEKYTKPDPYEWYSDCDCVHLPSRNWNMPAALQMYINMDKIADVVEKFKDKYDYFIVTRTDINVIFPYPDKHFFSIIPPGIYSVNAIYAQEWGGFHEPGFVHKNYILDVLRTPDNIIKTVKSRGQGINGHYNGEKFSQFCLQQANLTKNYINSLNFCFIAHDTNTATTWGGISFYEPLGCFVKYRQQADEVVQNNILWKSGYRWSFDCNTNSLNLTLPSTT